MIFQAGDIPSNLAPLGQPEVSTGPGKGCEGQDGQSTMAYHTYANPDLFPSSGVQFLVASATVTAGVDVARCDFAYGSEKAHRGDIERFQGYAGRTVLLYEELAQPAVGEERKMQHWLARNPGEPAAVEAYWASFRHDNVLAVLNLRFPQGNVTFEQFASLVQIMDTRVQEGLPALP